MAQFGGRTQEFFCNSDHLRAWLPVVAGRERQREVENTDEADKNHAAGLGTQSVPVRETALELATETVDSLDTYLDALRKPHMGDRREARQALIADLVEIITRAGGPLP